MGYDKVKLTEFEDREFADIEDILQTIADKLGIDFNSNLIKHKSRYMFFSEKTSSDTPTHLELYRAFPDIKGVCHTHSNYATSFAQAGEKIVAMGTTHADYFYGDIPCTRELTKDETETDYELNTGRVIIETFKNIDYNLIPAVLVKHHGVFTWGNSAIQSGQNAIVLEEVAKMNFKTFLLNDRDNNLPQYALNKHYYRKHGINAYYGQEE